MRSNAINFEIIAEKPFLLANYQKRLEAVDIQDGPANQVRLPFRV